VFGLYRLINNNLLYWNLFKVNFIPDFVLIYRNRFTHVSLYPVTNGNRTHDFSGVGYLLGK